MSTKTLLAVAALTVTSVLAATDGPEEPSLDCLIEPHLVIALSTRAEGVLEQVYVDRGDLIEAGQVVATLESGVERAMVDLARARAELTADLGASQAGHEYGQRKGARYADLFRRKAVADLDRDEVQTEAALAAFKVQKALEDRRIAELQLRQAVETLKLRTLTSPVRGVVLDRLLSPGESVEDRAILRIAQIDPLNVEALVPVARHGQVHRGMVGLVEPEVPVGGLYEARVTVVDRVMDAASGTFRVRLELPNPDYRLPAGLKCQVRLRPAPGGTQEDDPVPPSPAETTPPAEASPAAPAAPPADRPRLPVEATPSDKAPLSIEAAVPPPRPVLPTGPTPRPVDAAPRPAPTGPQPVGATPDPGEATPLRASAGTDSTPAFAAAAVEASAISGRPSPQPGGAPAPGASAPLVKASLPGYEAGPAVPPASLPATDAEPAGQPLAAAGGQPETAPATTCAVLGPFLQTGPAQRLQAVLAREGLEVALREGRGSVLRDHMVHTPREEDPEALRALARALREKGVEDLWVVPTGPQARTISLGVVGPRASAERLQRDLARRGVEARVTPRFVERPEYWLDVRLPDDEAILEGLRQRARTARVSADLAAATCPTTRVAARP
jgi:RND family efflux transporter MFP subunit